ncbi:unnamed protein product (macronuclear) [Paramecium tetraurelia]|uniref:Uncharacterized protein n=1 Tax=Paramecium tetraurelia TaxID=5888 RepID=A0BWV0_PARTE|nr:uncharacterized protein GSPATT00032869001 [Paramecium tetraurelia]CAK63017.1 unnamed protein product [Paramecium tetraurelia]|eukprot:XP_001430415.1 hypothetical protein (macronuclear) [Paramecium tetraurelia strain d4-2]
MNYEEALKIAAKEEVAFFGQCSKFKERPTDPAPVDRAIHFLFLKENNVDRKTALQFGMRRLCKIDSTRHFDGPADHRIMKTNKLLSGAVNGWHNGAAEAKFDLGSGYTIDVGKQQDHSFHQKNNYPIDLRVQTQERDKITMQRFEFSKFNTERLTQELCKLKEETQQKNNQPKLYVEMAGQKIFHLLDQDNHKPSLLQEFQAFSTIEDLVRLHQVKSLDKIEPTSNLQESSTSRSRQRAMTNLQDQRHMQFQKKRLSAYTGEDSQKIYKKLLKQLRSDDQIVISSGKHRRIQYGRQMNPPNTSRRNSPQSFFFNLTNKQTVPSNTSISNSQQNFDSSYKKPLIQRSPQLEKTTVYLEQKLENFIQQRLIIQNSKSLSPEIDCTNLQFKKDLFKQLKQKEIQRISKVRINSQR